MRRQGVARGIATACATTVVAISWAAPAQGFSNWPGYLFNPTHSSRNGAATAISVAHAPAVSQAWAARFAKASTFFGSPTVYKGSVYIGSFGGTFSQLSETTGAVLHQVNLGSESSCTRSGKSGVASTATVAADPSRGGAGTVYVTGVKDGSNGGIVLWALDAGTLQPVWTTDPVVVDEQPGAYPWSSPTVSGGQISVGISSGCDSPLVRGGLAVFNQSDGSPLGTYYTVPPGSVGGTIWSSAAASGSSKWVTTGNADETRGSIAGDSFSIVRLEGASKVDIWTVPNLTGTDDDFGASPTLFTGSVGGVSTPLVGACNKNGTFYALRRFALSSGPVWSFRVSQYGCLSAAVWDGPNNQLIIGGTGTATPINGVKWPGSIRALRPNAAVSNRVVWEMGLPCSVIGTPTENGAGVVAVVTYSSCLNGSSPALYLLNARNPTPNAAGNPSPQVLKVIPLPSSAFSQPTFADSELFVASLGVMAYH